MIIYTALKKAVTKGLVNPKNDLFFKILEDVNDKDYYMNRAVECIRTAMIIESKKELYESPLDKSVRAKKVDEQLTKAILNIALARLQ